MAGRSEGLKSNSVSKEARRPFASLRHDQTHCLVSPSSHLHEHPLAEELAKGTEYEAGWSNARCYANMSEFDRIKNLNKKEGVSLGRFAIHPLTGEKIPMGRNFVLATYGAVMAVPGMMSVILILQRPTICQLSASSSKRKMVMQTMT